MHSCSVLFYKLVVVYMNHTVLIHSNAFYVAISLSAVVLFI